MDGFMLSVGGQLFQLFLVLDSVTSQAQPPRRSIILLLPCQLHPRSCICHEYVNVEMCVNVTGNPG